MKIDNYQFNGKGSFSNLIFIFFGLICIILLYVYNISYTIHIYISIIIGVNLSVYIWYISKNVIISDYSIIDKRLIFKKEILWYKSFIRIKKNKEVFYPYFLWGLIPAEKHTVIEIRNSESYIIIDSRWIKNFLKLYRLLLRISKDKNIKIEIMDKKRQTAD